MGDAGIDPADPPCVQAARSTRAAGARCSTGSSMLVEEMGRKRSVPDHMYARTRRVVRELRATLARASVQTLEPDLVILDEFQRFRHLLDPSNRGRRARPPPLRVRGREGAAALGDAVQALHLRRGERRGPRVRPVQHPRVPRQGPHDVDVQQIRSQLREYREVVTRGHDGELGHPSASDQPAQGDESRRAARGVPRARHPWSTFEQRRT